MNRKVIFTIVFNLVFFASLSAFTQISAPSATGSFTTDYTDEFLSIGEQNDFVYVFCGDYQQNNTGELIVDAPDCDVVWFAYDGISFSEMGVEGEVADGLESGLYMAKVYCDEETYCYRAWVWVNQLYVSVNPPGSGCETFTLSAEVDVLDDEFIINDPPGSNFEIDEDTYIKVCFWAEHTYVSDLGFYLKAPGYQEAEPGEDGVVQLAPSPSDWGENAAYGSWTGIDWSVLGCSDPNDENSVCNSGNDVQEFCFVTHNIPGGMEIPAGHPTYTPCVCDMPTPLTGNFGSVGTWSTIYGANAADPGWIVQIYDCRPADIGGLTRATITFVGETECGTATFHYDSEDIYSPINDGSCDAQSASIFIVPPTEPVGIYNVSSSITNYSWTSTGSSFTGNQPSHEIVYGTSDFPADSSTFTLTVTETIDAPGNIYCQVTSSGFFETIQTDAGITPVSPTCPNSESIFLEAIPGGGTFSTNAQDGSISENVFFPEIAGPGTWEITYEITGDCAVTDNINITVYETIDIINFSDNICDPTNTEYSVSFDVVDSNGIPSDFYVNWGTGNQLYSGSFDRNYLTTAIYNITVTDVNSCYEYTFSGLTDCDCETFAGNMTSITPVNLCEFDCTNDVTHEGNHFLDGNDLLEFALHDGEYPANIIARNSNPTFCFDDIPDGEFGVTYYISAIAGDNVGGEVDQSDNCYSQSFGTPVIWYEQPEVNIVSDDYQEVCDLSITLEAEPASPGMTGYWTASHQFFPGGGSNVNSPVINILVTEYDLITFYWNINNGFCTASDSVKVNFKQAPNAYAGENFTICGTSAELQAIPSVEGSIGQWTGSASFNPQNSPDTEVNVSSSGQYVFTWTEFVADCEDSDNVIVTFIEEPNPSIIVSNDTVCGFMYDLMVYNTDPTNNGSWTAYQDGEILSPAPIYTPNAQTHDASVMIGSYSELYKEIEFVWTETAQSQGVTCTAEASMNVVFAQQPVASVGANDEAEVCGNCFTFNADTTGSGWATGRWMIKDNATGVFDDENDPHTSVCIDTLGVFGDTARVRVEFLWIMTNYGCSSIDTMNVTFYRRPYANAGLDNAICGNDYELGAVYNIPQSSGYSPSGIWTVHTPVTGASANIVNENQDSTDVTVSNYGQWIFQFRENNSYLTSCYTVDTVRIEFLEIPVVDAGDDKHVCGKCTEMEATSSQFAGTWLDNGALFEDYNNPNTGVCVNQYGNINFVWMESNHAQTSNETCTSVDTVKINFWRNPEAVILTDEADSTTCGLTFNNLRAQLPGTGITGYWWNETDPDAQYGNPNSHNTHVTVNTFGYHDFYWIAANGPTFQPDFCLDTAGPLTIHFIEIPEADAGGDTLFCGYSGNLSANPSVGTGVWSTPSSELITFDNINDPNSGINSQVLTGGSNPYFNIIWTEDNTNECTDRDTIKVRFARIPSSKMNIVPPKCFGEPATISAKEDSLQEYSWNFYSGIIDSIVPENNAGGFYEHFVYWTNQDTAHQVSLVATNYWGCQSLITIDTVFEPKIPDFEMEIIGDTCLLDRGGVILLDTMGTNAFYWIDSAVGPPVNTPITAVYNIPEGEYGIRARYRTINQDWYNYYIQTFGNANCTDTVYFEIEPIGLMEALFEVSPLIYIDELVAPEAEVIFNNLSDYGGVRRRCIWNFGDGNTLTSCDEQVEHTYTEPNCYEPFLIIMNRDLQECRDTAFIEACIKIDNESNLEIPNIFTPNNDGINDFFQVKAETLKSFKGYIVNRWGVVIYEWTNWQDEDAGWDGKLPGGTYASPGVYYYIISAEGMDEVIYEKQGVLHLYRD